ncbi:MAG: hypothetical protein IT530_16050 [Burkholderiales bacterium]|nr:hypothetical protein [Burkholderiales bacterium]
MKRLWPALAGALFALTLYFAPVMPVTDYRPLTSIQSTAHAGALGDYLENKLVDHVFRATAYTAPSTIYAGLSTSACSDSSIGTEVSGGSYARVAITTGTTAFKGTHGSTSGASSGTNGTISNAAAVTFPAPTANWGSVTHWFLADASSGGNVLICAALTVPKTINNGDAAPSFAIDAMTIQIDSSADGWLRWLDPLRMAANDAQYAAVA